MGRLIFNTAAHQYSRKIFLIIVGDIEPGAIHAYISSGSRDCKGVSGVLRHVKESFALEVYMPPFFVEILRDA